MTKRFITVTWVISRSGEASARISGLRLQVSHFIGYAARSHREPEKGSTIFVRQNTYDVAETVDELDRMIAEIEE